MVIPPRIKVITNEIVNKSELIKIPFSLFVTCSSTLKFDGTSKVGSIISSDSLGAFDSADMEGTDVGTLSIDLSEEVDSDISNSSSGNLVLGSCSVIESFTTTCLSCCRVNNENNPESPVAIPSPAIL